VCTKETIQLAELVEKQLPVSTDVSTEAESHNLATATEDKLRRLSKCYSELLSV
jgi:hypothetical protein